MVYLGRVEKGVVVIDGSARPQEGAIVRIEEVRPSETQQVGQELDGLAGLAQDLPSDLAQRHDHYRREHP